MQIDYNQLLNTQEVSMLATKAISWLTTNGLRLPFALLIFYLGRWMAKKIVWVVSTAMRRRAMDEALIRFMEDILYYAILMAVVVAAVSQVGVNVASFLAVLGAAGLAIGLALKDSLSNFASGVMIIMLRLFHVGDWITAGGVSGTVRQVSIFYTRLDTADNQTVIVPNSKIMGDVIVNTTANETRRIDLVIGIGYDDDIEKARKAITRVVEASKVLKEPKPLIAVDELADSSVNFVVRPWVKTSEYWDVRRDLIEKIKLALDEEGVNIPYPQTDVHLHQS